ncbi:hypothetical protein N665_0059s0015, partial [Sinapis alba]
SCESDAADPSPSFSFPNLTIDSSVGSHPQNIEDGIPRLPRVLSQKSRSTKSRQAAVAKVSEVSSLLSRAGTMGLGKAVDVLDTLGSSMMTNLNLSGGFSSATTTKGNSISILSFEVANTIVKDANLMPSLSKESIAHLKAVVLLSKGVQNLVVRFGNRCKDPQYHNLDRFFHRLGSEFTSHKHLKQEAEFIMHQLMTFFISLLYELYHELHALDRFEQDYQRVGDTLAILRTELKSQKKHVTNLKKKSLWSRIMEKVMEKLVDVVHFLHLEIHESFGGADLDKPANDPPINHKKWALLALPCTTQTSLLKLILFTRDALYQGLPPSIKSALHSRIQSFQVKEELTVPQIKAEMEKKLQWLVPVATNTTKAHHGFRWVGEWASSGSEANQRPAGQTILRIDTLHHADKEKTEDYILDLVVWLHHLVTKVRATTGFGLRSPVKSPIRSPNQKTIQLSRGSQNPSMDSPFMSMEDKEMLRDVSNMRKTPGISQSQEFHSVDKSRLCKHHRLSKSSSHSSMMGEMMKSKKDRFSIRRPSSILIINFDIDRVKALDVIDRVDTIRSL